MTDSGTGSGSVAGITVGSSTDSGSGSAIGSSVDASVLVQRSMIADTDFPMGQSNLSFRTLVCRNIPLNPWASWSDLNTESVPVNTMGIECFSHRCINREVTAPTCSSVIMA